MPRCRTAARSIPQRRPRLRLALLLALAAAAAPAAVRAQGMAAGERARGESRCPAGLLGEAVPGGFHCVRPEFAAAPQAVPVPGSGAAGGQAREVSRGPVAGPWLLGAGALAVIGAGVAAASQGGGSSTPSGTR